MAAPAVRASAAGRRFARPRRVPVRHRIPAACTGAPPASHTRHIPEVGDFGYTRGLVDPYHPPRTGHRPGRRLRRGGSMPGHLRVRFVALLTVGALWLSTLAIP